MMPCLLYEHLRQHHTYSEDLRKHIVYQRFTRNKIIPDIALDLNMSHHVLEHILELWKATGEVIPQEPGRKGQRQK